MKVKLEKLNFEETTVNKKDQISKPNGTEPTINAALLYSLNDGKMKIVNFCKTTLWEKILEPEPQCSQAY